MFEQAYTMPGFGAEWKARVKSETVARIGLTGFGEMLARSREPLLSRPDKKDAWGVPVLRIDVQHGDNEAAMARDMIEQAVAMLEAAGAEEITTRTELPPPGFAIHEVGTARMGNDPKTSVLTPFLQTHDVKNLFVMDGSSYVSIGCVNPTLTMMALTVRACENLVGRGEAGQPGMSGNGESARSAMKDNELTRRTAVGLAAGAALSLAAGERWVFAAREGDVVKTPADGSAWRPVLFDERQAEGLARLVDALIPRTTTPGARDARVHEYIDLAVSLEPPDDKKAFVDGLALARPPLQEGLRRRSGDGRSKPTWSSCSARSATSTRRCPSRWRAGQRFFADLKRRTIFGYYTSLEGRVQELGLPDSRVDADLARLPASGRPAHHVAAGSRCTGRRR